jgi:RNA polymerase sigma-70 factor, ECF subfamily
MPAKTRVRTSAPRPARRPARRAGPRHAPAYPAGPAHSRLASCGVVDSDADLVERARSGDEDAFAGLVGRYQNRLLRLAESLLPSRAVAEEVVQDTWLGVVRGIERFQGQSTFKTWLFRILVNRARTAGAREPRFEPLGRDSEAAVPAARFDRSGSWAVPPEAWAEAAEDRVAAGQLAALIRGFLEQLPVSQRQVVLLRDVEGLPSQHVCQVLGIKDGHQRVLLHRGRARVRRLLDVEMGSRR